MSNVLRGIEWAVDTAAASSSAGSSSRIVVNLSLGGLTRSETENRFFEELAEKHGAVFVAAAGNSGSRDRYYPSSYDAVLSVAAVDATNKHAFFSNYNSAVNVSAPGTEIVTMSLPYVAAGDGGSNNNEEDDRGVVFITLIGEGGESNAISGHWIRRSGTVEYQTGPLVQCDKDFDESPCISNVDGDEAPVCLIPW